MILLIKRRLRIRQHSLTESYPCQCENPNMRGGTALLKFVILEEKVSYYRDFNEWIIISRKNLNSCTIHPVGKSESVEMYVKASVHSWASKTSFFFIVLWYFILTRKALFYFFFYWFSFYKTTSYDTTFNPRNIQLLRIVNCI